jgi:hypothetical protein
MGRFEQAMKVKTPFHEAADRFVLMLDGSRKMFSQLTDVMSAIAYQDFTNDWAPDMAERFFKFNKAQKKFQRDFRDWADSITEEDWNLVRSLFLGPDAGWTAQGGDEREIGQKAAISYDRQKAAKSRAASKSRARRYR